MYWTTCLDVLQAIAGGSTRILVIDYDVDIDRSLKAQNALCNLTKVIAKLDN